MTELAKITTTDAAETMVPADPMVSMIERVAMDPNADLAKLERMLELKEKHDANQAKAAFAFYPLTGWPFLFPLMLATA